MTLAASQLVQRAGMLQLEEYLHALQLGYLADDVPAQRLDLSRFALALIEHCRVEGHEAVVLGTDQHHPFELGQAFAVRQLHEDGFVEFDRLEVELLEVLDLVHLDQVPHSQIYQVVVALRNAQVRRREGDKEVELRPVLLQMPKGRARDQSSKREAYKVDGGKEVERVTDVPCDFFCSLAPQVLNGLVHFVSDRFDDQNMRALVRFS